MRKINLEAFIRLSKKRLQKRLSRIRKHKTSSHKPDAPQFKLFHQKVVAPKNFSFIDNIDEMLSFFKRGDDLAKKRINVKFDLSEVEELTPDAIAVFVSLFNNPSYNQGVHMTGNAPKDPTIKRMFMGSGFYDHVKSQAKPKVIEGNFLLHKVSNKKVETSIAKTATDFCAKYTFKDSRKFRPVYEILIELMANTNNHASPIGPSVYDWWLYIFYDKKTNTTSYSFLDFGIGIFKSKSFIKYSERFFLTFKSTQSTKEMAEDLLNGKISSRTGLSERGKGFKCMTENAKNENINRFYIVSNRVYIDVKNRSSREIETDFNGTFIYWEVTNEN